MSSPLQSSRAPLLWLLAGSGPRRGCVLGLAYGLAFHGATLYWILRFGEIAQQYQQGFTGFERFMEIPDIRLVSDSDHFVFRPNGIYVPFGADPESLLGKVMGNPPLDGRLANTAPWRRAGLVPLISGSHRRRPNTVST